MKQKPKITAKKYNYAIIDIDDNIIQKFKLKLTAISWLTKKCIKLNEKEKLRIINLK
jgi:hypothetical protein